MVITLSTIFVFLISYFLYLIKKQNKKINILKDIITYSIKSQVTENKLYLLDEIDNNSTFNLDILYKELEKDQKNKFQIYVEKLINSKAEENKNYIIREFQKNNTEIKKYIDNLHQQLISNEFAKLRSDINKDLNDIVESVKNIKIF